MADAAVASSPALGHDNTDTEGNGSSDAGNKFQAAISAWRNVDLTTLVSNLDNTASEIVAYQRDSTVQRKDLAQKTKDFRKHDDATKLTEIKGLLKAYQTFIDLLTNHSKSVNSAFIQTYNSLSEVPDPYPLLEASVDSMLVAEDTLPKVTEENKHLQKTVTKLTTQLEETETKLQTELSARKSLEETLETKVKDVEQSWTAVLEEKKENWEAKEKAFDEKIENQDRLLSEIKASYEVSQRLGRAEEAGEDGQRPYVTSAELEMVNADLERTSARLADVEARNEHLIMELAQTKSALPEQSKAIEDDPAYLQVLSQNSSLVRKLDANRVEKEALKRDLDTKLRGLDREVGLLRDERDTLKGKVQKWSDYEDVKQELEVLKSIEFSTGDDDETAPADSGNTASSGTKDKDTLEQLLLARNRKLNEEATILRVSHQDLQARLTTLEGEVAQRNAEVDRLHKLTEKLENDLATVEAEAPNAFPSGASVAGTYVSRFAPTIGGRRSGRPTSPTSSIISGFDPRFTSGGSGGGEGVGGGSGILPMITAQRDRFKKRIAQLEQELSDERRTVSQLRQEIAALQKDNLNLYEKTRYISTYNRGGTMTSSSSTAAYGSNANPSTVAIGGGSGSDAGSGLTMDRYRKTYESNLSPFQAFRGRESARAFKRMSLPERAVYSVTRMVLSTRTSRNLFAAYCVALHLLVFLSLYWQSGTQTDLHSSNFGHHAAMAAAAAGGGPAGAGAAVAGGAAAGAGSASHGDWHEEGFSH